MLEKESQCIEGLLLGRVRALLITHHRLEEIRRIADRVTVINQGQSCFDGTVDAFRAQADDDNLRRAFMNVLHGPMPEGD